ncbi:MAG: M1 family metallopeptidase [bacterium]|nr:M1 family metallopeptidase [bacterium]MCP4798903.1 M1 family metallopeptidase [bacterium]
MKYFALLLLIPVFASAEIVSHNAGIYFDTDAHTVAVTDTLQIPDGVTEFVMNSKLEITGAEAIKTEDELTTYKCTPGQMIISYIGEFFANADDMVFSRENVGRELTATISDDGIYLSGGAYWLPMFEEAMVTHKLTINTPAGIEPVTQGVRTVVSKTDRQITIWDAKNPSDGLNLVAAKYFITERQFGDVTSYTYFLADEPKLVETYQTKTGEYLEMYNEMIGPYPYGKFATVESWFPSGYGMPSYTLLGGMVIRLPFIPDTSFGHEICHNWWGNSSFVDGDRGNWCEGLTVYCADYHYKTLLSAEDGREYRRTLLKDYASYVHGDLDFPISEFKERHSGATRAIGYGKTMMVFHMFDRMIGRDNFVKAMQDVWSSNSYAPVSWDHFIAAFSGYNSDITELGEQWLTRAGAPMIHLQDVESDGAKVTFTITQNEPVWDIEVPVVVGDAEHVLQINSASATFTLPTAGAKTLSVDPDYHVFRKLHAEEIEPTLSQIFGEEEPQFVIPSGLAGIQAKKFAEEWVEGEEFVTSDGTYDGHSRIFVNPSAETAAELLPENAQLAGSYMFLNGARYKLKENDIVLAIGNEFGKTDLIVFGHSYDALPKLAGRISHYGKYSHLIFPQRGRPQKGNWEIKESPLNRRIK